MVDRLNRQMPVLGAEGQAKITNSRVAVLGTNQLANSTLVAMTAVGFGHIRIIGDGYVKGDLQSRVRDGFLYFASNSGKKVDALVDILSKIGTEIKDGLEGFCVSPSDATTNVFLKHTDVVIDATNSPNSKNLAFNFCKENRIPFISAATSGDKGSMIVYEPPRSIEKKLVNILEKKKFVYDLPFYANKEQGFVTSGVMGGEVVGELRKLVCPLEHDNLVFRPVNYNLRSKKRIGKKDDILHPLTSLHGKSILQIGCGAVGTYSALWLSLLGARLCLVDDDTVDETNLNRQVLYYGCVKHPKANSLARRLKEISGYDIGYMKKRIGEDSLDVLNKFEPDLVLSCVDSIEARLAINNLLMNYKRKIPLIEGSASENSAQVNVCVPEITPCLRHQRWNSKGADEYLKNTILSEREEAKKKKNLGEVAGCMAVGDPSIVMPDLVGGSIMAAESLLALQKNPDFYLRANITYDRSSLERLVIGESTDIPEAKTCYSKNCIFDLKF